MGAGVSKETRSLVGIVLVDKPAGLTSNRVLQKTKRLFNARKAGHTGTLDPMATGMLPICFGAATKVSGLMLESSKRYRVTATFGVETDTGDATGAEIRCVDLEAPQPEQVRAKADELTGHISQVPPMYSALKHAGRRLYELARQGQEVERKAREVEIFTLDVEEIAWPDVTLLVHCSKGTYVRTLVTDLAAKLGTVAHVSALRRLSVGPFEESGMVPFETLEQDAACGLEQLDRWVIGADAALLDRPAVTVDAVGATALRQGQRIPIGEADGQGSVRIYDPGGKFVGLGEVEPGQSLKPARIFPS
jgi:tRNA pseudouridine55 synthase